MVARYVKPQTRDVGKSWALKLPLSRKTIMSKVFVLGMDAWSHLHDFAGLAVRHPEGHLDRL